MPIINAQNKTQNCYFSKGELSRILALYSKRVAAGQWRDYAIDYGKNVATFSIFRSSYESPLYTVEKKQLKGSENWIYSISDRRKKLAQRGRLEDVLKYLDGYLDKMPKLVKK